MADGRLMRIARRVAALHTYLGEDFLGGPKRFRVADVINLQKGSTAFYVAALMLVYRNSSPAAWTMLGLYGSYGACWLIKDACFPDPSWRRRVTAGGAGVTALLLGLYWVIPFLLISPVLGAKRRAPAPALLAACTALHTLGIAIMLSADAQKFFTLRQRRGLITDGLFARVRHPNYLGEMMVYASYALLVRHPLPWVLLGWIWTQIFGTNMMMVEASLARYPEWNAYRARTGMLLPRLLPKVGTTSEPAPALEARS
jgi:protein-S-isoprenylcysteine O-methyltransferase Ste14